MTSYEKLEARFCQHNRLGELRAISQWDEAVVMPTGAGDSRGQALAELSLLMQNLIAAPEVGDWIQDALARPSTLSPWQMANLKEIKRQYVENTAVPAELNQQLVIARMKCEQRWRQLRTENDWIAFVPSLREVLGLTRQMLRELGSHTGTSLYDTAQSLYAKGLTTAIVEKMFTELKGFLPHLIQRVVAKQSREIVIKPEGRIPMAAQKALGQALMKSVGFDFTHGRLDESHHPFCGGTPRDVRITTRYDEHEFLSSLMGVLHETGHALYEQNLPAAWIEQPVGAACGMAIHESQSLFMEMQLVRSREFLTFAAPLIREHLSAHVSNPEALDSENLIRLVTRVKPGLIRVDADEVTYPAHVILRFEIERDLLEDRWPLTDLPAVWNQKMTEYLGLSTLGNDRDGCMQDVHWPSGSWGYFPSYTFGAVIAAQLFAAVEKEIPALRPQITQGQFAPVQGWLREKIWQEGSRFDTLELVQRAAGPLSTASFRRHLERRYL